MVGETWPVPGHEPVKDFRGSTCDPTGEMEMF